MITALPDPGSQHLVRGAQRSGGARPGGARGRAPGDPPARWPLAGAKPGARPGRGRAGAVLARPPGGRPLPLPSAGHRRRPDTKWRRAEAAISWCPRETKATGRGGPAAAGRGLTAPEAGRPPCAEAWECPAREGQAGPFWTLPPAQAPSHPGVPQAPSPCSRGSGWCEDRLLARAVAPVSSRLTGEWTGGNAATRPPRTGLLWGERPPLPQAQGGRSWHPRSGSL